MQLSQPKIQLTDALVATLRTPSWRLEDADMEEYGQTQIQTQQHTVTDTIVKVKVIFAVVKQLKQLQRKPRKKYI